MALFRKSVAPAGAITGPEEVKPPEPLPPPISGPAVNFDAVYDFGHVTAEERDRVRRARELLGVLPKNASHKKEVVDATLRVFGVDAEQIIAASAKQLSALESFLRSSQDHAQRIADESKQHISELEAEIARSRQLTEQTVREQEERARTVKAEIEKLEQVQGFFGKDEVDIADPLDAEPTGVDRDPLQAKGPKPGPLLK
jgi:hypothetical protein